MKVVRAQPCCSLSFSVSCKFAVTSVATICILRVPQLPRYFAFISTKFAVSMEIRGLQFRSAAKSGLECFPEPWNSSAHKPPKRVLHDNALPFAFSLNTACSIEFAFRVHFHDLDQYWMTRKTTNFVLDVMEQQQLSERSNGFGSAVLGMSHTEDYVHRDNSKWSIFRYCSSPDHDCILLQHNS